MTRDLNGDSTVNWLDLEIFADRWLDIDAGNLADLNSSGNVDWTDYALFANYWLDTTTPAPVSLWQFNETSGDTASDSSGNGHSGTCYAVDWSPTGGKYDGAAKFDAGTDYVSVPTAGMNANAGTIALWVNPTANEDSVYFYGHTSNPADTVNRIQLKTNTIKPNRRLRVGMGGNGTALDNIYTLVPGSWYHIALTWSGSGGTGIFKVYVNGNPVSSDIGYTQLSALGTFAHIGNIGKSTVSVGGARAFIDDVAVWGQPLNAADIADLYSNGFSIPPAAATGLNPANGISDIAITAGLSWTAGSGAASHNVYFGSTNPPLFKVNRTLASCDPGLLSAFTVYYWRIDEINSAGTTAGNLSSFTTGAIPVPGKASNPDPASGATSVSVSTTLSWTAGINTVSHDVYFDSTNPPKFLANTTTNHCQLPALTASTTYYWHIDEGGILGEKTTGDLWSFTTTSTQPPDTPTNPSPTNGAAGVPAAVALCWTAGFNTTSHNIYFGTANPPPFAANSLVTNYRLPTLSYSTVYYWRINEIGDYGSANGDLWSFTTASPPATTTYTNDTSIFANPERGWAWSYQTTSNDQTAPVLTVSELQNMRNSEDKITLVRKYYQLRSFLNGPISDTYLNNLRADLQACRDAGIKMIPRFVYVYILSYNKSDAPLSRVQGHLDQLQPVFQDYMDAIAFIEMGMVGWWGEWHDSYLNYSSRTPNTYVDNYTLAMLPDGITLRNKILSVVPPQRMVQMRRLYWYKEKIWPNPVTESTAYNQSIQSRIGYHNDGVMDLEQWIEPGCGECPPYNDSVTYAEEDSKWTVYAGEPSSLEENSYALQADPRPSLKRFHWSALVRNANDGEDAAHYIYWKNNGYFDDLTRYLGYRFHLTEATVPASAAQGNIMNVQLKITNDGYAAPYNERPFYIVLRPTGGGNATYLYMNGQSGADPRYWLGQTNRTLDLTATIPSDMTTGTYDVLLYFPDPKPPLHGRADFSIQLASLLNGNTIWESSTGFNRLGTTIQVTSSCSPTADR